MSVASDKRLMRAAIRKKLIMISPAEIKAQSEALCGRISETAAFRKAKIVFAYMAMPCEADVSFLALRGGFPGKAFAFPRCIAGELEFFIPRDEHSFVRGAYGIWEPDPLKSEKVPASGADLIMTPGMAFDRQCGRLGRGMGYYDRLIMHSKGVKIGIALTEQIVENIPAEEHDLPVDMVASQFGIYC